MATLQELERALVNADKAGDTDAARRLAAFITEARKDTANQIPGAVVPSTIPQAPEPGVMDTLAGVGEAGLAMATGVTGGTVGMIGGALGGLAQQILSGQFGTPQAMQAVQEAAMQGSQAMTYQPRGQVGQEITQAFGKAFEVVPPVIPVIGPMGAMAQSAKATMPLAMATGKRVAAPAIQAAQNVAERAKQVMPQQPTAFGSGSIGAAEAGAARVRQTTAANLPVPLEGEAGLTAGQATRNFEQLQFEKETAKRADLGAPLRERIGNQSAVLSKNFEVLIDRIDPATTELRDIGKNVDQALKNKMGVANRRISAAYKAADEAGEMLEPVDMIPLAPRLAELDRFAGVAPNIGAIQKEAVRLGALVPDADGRLQPGTISLADTELMRQFVNEATDWSDKRQSMVAKRVNESIDMATEGLGGELYREARNLKRDYIREFENVGLTKKLTTTKRGTDERNIAYEDVFQKIVVDSPLEEMNKLRGTLLKAGPDGKQSWLDLKAQGIEYIKSKAYSAVQKDEKGNPLLSPAALTKTVNQLDKEGKLDAIYGKKQAQVIRDLSELSQVIYTAPPGAINTSGTASALMVAMDSAGTFGLSGMPVPAVTLLRESAKYVKNRQLKARINQSLNFGKE